MLQSDRILRQLKSNTISATQQLLLLSEWRKALRIEESEPVINLNISREEFENLSIEDSLMFLWEKVNTRHGDVPKRYWCPSCLSDTWRAYVTMATNCDTCGEVINRA